MPIQVPSNLDSSSQANLNPGSSPLQEDIDPDPPNPNPGSSPLQEDIVSDPPSPPQQAATPAPLTQQVAMPSAQQAAPEASFKKKKHWGWIFSIIIIGFFALLVVYYYLSNESEPVDMVFLSISTFVFAIFTGFFISRQGARYSSLREKISKFDGNMSSIYRVFGHLGLVSQAQAGQIITSHYYAILQNRAWDYHISNKSHTLTYLHQLLETTTQEQSLPTLKSAAVTRITIALHDAQLIRKDMVSLHRERIPKSQWILLIFLAIILFILLSTIPSQLFILGAILKAAFGAALLFILVMLYQLDKLSFFEGLIGENSAADVLGIIRGER
ncbi:hypothetical protein ACFL1U_02795 [Patescibacteria group bacterium]